MVKLILVGDLVQQTALKLAVSRMKLLKNKREIYLKQLRKELAQLLHTGHDHTATIRVEHVVREEKTMAAYDLIEIYCELIAARLPIIESHKKCPIDLKEAISSVIFASPRCSDIPELMDVQKHIMAKYGKEFVASAVELCPDCGVNCMLVEKLSAKAPDGPTKIKILTAIAEEHGVKWQPKQFGEKQAQSSQYSVAGPNAFEKATYVEPPQVHVPPVEDEKGPPNLHVMNQLKEFHDIPTNSYEHSSSVATRKAGGDRSKTSGRSNPEIRSLVSGTQEMDFRDSYCESSRQNWNMEFKDAASAAKAAAECAEHASMAARAALLLSNREKLARWYSSGPHSSSGSESRGEVPQEYAFHAAKHLSTGSVDSTFHRSSFRKHSEQINVREQDYQSASHASSSAFGIDNPFSNVSPHSNSFKQDYSDSLHEMSPKKQISRTGVDFVTKRHADMMAKSYDDTGYARPRTNGQFDKASSSHFVDKEYNREESGLFFSSTPGSKSQVDTLSNTSAWSSGQDIDQKESSSGSQSRFSVVSEKLAKPAVPSRKEYSFPDIFDDPDGPSSNSDEDLVKSVSRNLGFGNSILDQSENDNVEKHFESKVSISGESEKNFGDDDLRIHHASFSGRSRTIVSGYTNSKSVQLEHKALQNEQYGLPQRTSGPLKSGITSLSLKDGPSSKGQGLGWKSIDEKASTMSMMNKSTASATIPCSQERPRHVHPKLPDYESFTAYFLSLKKARQ